LKKPTKEDLARAKELIHAIEDALRAGYKPMGVQTSRHEKGAVRVAGETLGMARKSLYERLRWAIRITGKEPDWKIWNKVKVVGAQAQSPQDMMLSLLRKEPIDINNLARRCGMTPGQTLDAINEQRNKGVNIVQRGEVYLVGRDFEPSFTKGPVLEYVSRPDNTYLFGALGDSHLGSKYERLDVLHDLYKIYEENEVDRVFHTGNWIDGLTSFNVNDLLVHGMEPQLKYLAENYPHKDGICTYAVTGEDHEGWFARREGIDIGKRAEQTMREHEREDWVNLGFVEAHVRLVNANTGKFSTMSVVHPGGGTAYALSYTPQKIIEGLEGGEKPAVMLIGHYHKLLAMTIRNVWVAMTGCQQDQTIFTRNKTRQEMHVGGTMIKLRQDPDTGAITSMTPDLIRYFVKSYYNGRFSKSGAVNLPKRAR